MREGVKEAGLVVRALLGMEGEEALMTETLLVDADMDTELSSVTCPLRKSCL